MNAPILRLARSEHDAIAAADAAAVLAAYGGGWPARLSIRVARGARGSVPVAVDHEGPLRLQKALWPEGPDPAHLMLLHPPGGIAGGDRLSLDLSVERAAHALATTPGAGKWYRADTPSWQRIRLEVAEQASLEWLPQETIVHAGADAHSTIEVGLAGDARAVGIEIVVLGRRASGERFEQGRLLQHLRIRRGERLLFEDRTLIDAGPSLQGPAALGDAHVSGLLWICGAAAFAGDAAADAEAAMQECAPGLFGASCVEPDLLVARAVGDSPERVRRALVAVWSRFRVAVFGRAPRVPRIWLT